MIKAAIFDFNGTLYYDQDINVGSWVEFYKFFYNTNDITEEFSLKALTQNTRMNIIDALKSVNKELDEDVIKLLSHKKETFYHEIAIEKMRFNLADGVETVLDYFKNNNIKLNMCTASIKYNLDFYYEMTDLNKWFNKKLVSYDNGICDGKVEMYINAAKSINVDPKDCVVFEDTLNGINDAIKAGYDKIIYVNHYNKEKINYKEIIQEIHEYSELDYSLFK